MQRCSELTVIFDLENTRTAATYKNLWCLLTLLCVIYIIVIHQLRYQEEN
jgi:hypothetical protein